ncbi:glycosyltransferase [Martelella soudanensis]|uniref:glycosyltransferase n=1 Tax=unclassified Martelella TaxID=2629616 RepID=UPI0015DF26AE|nr:MULTISPECIES: glycosyltransferase [unclassified Martelella]
MDDDKMVQLPEHKITKRSLRLKSFYHHPFSGEKRKSYRRRKLSKLAGGAGMPADLGPDFDERKERRKIRYTSLLRHPFSARKRRKYRRKRLDALTFALVPSFAMPAPPPRMPHSSRAVTTAPTLWFYLGDTMGWLEAHDRLTGVGRVSVELFDAFLQEPTTSIRPCRTGRSDLDIVAIGSAELQESVLNRLDGRYGSGLGAFDGGSSPAKGEHVFFTGLVWTPKFSALFRHLSSRGIGFSVLVHDIIPLEGGDNVNEAEGSRFAEWLLVCLQSADRLYVSTNVVRDQILRWALLEGVEVAAEIVKIPFGSKPLREEEPLRSESLQERFPSLESSNFVLSVGTIDPRKNQIMLCRLWRNLIASGLNVPQLVLAGRDDLGLGKDQSIYRDLLRSGKLLVLSGLGDADIAALTAACRFTAFPSTSEGYGLPVAESLLQGKLCLASRLAVIEEQAGELAWYFDVDDSLQAEKLFRKAIEDRDAVIAAEAKIRADYVRPTWAAAARRLEVEGIKAARERPVSIIPGRFLPEFPGAERFKTSEVLKLASRWCTNDAPEVSILIVNWNASPLTLECIRQIWMHTEGHTYEIVIVDNGSDEDDIARLSRPIPGVVFIPIGRNRFFGEANNIAAEAARGKYIVLLNNDAFPQDDWLPSLMNMMAENPSLGAAGPMFLWPDGRVQEAGGMINEGGYPVRFGRGQDHPSPDILMERYVDYISAAAMLVERALFIRVGGFDLTFEPAYYEDSDLCFKLKALGRPVAYCPASRVIHIEGAAANGNTKAEARRKALGDSNRDKFVSRWERLLKSTGEKEPVFSVESFIPAKWSSPPGKDRPLPVAVVFTPYAVTPGGGERYILSAARQLARTHRVEVVTPYRYSNLRLQQIGCALNLDLGMLRFKTLQEFEKDPEPDLMLTMGNAVLPPIPARGRKTVYHCQFPFVLKEAEASNEAMLQTYQEVMVNSAFTQGFYGKRLAEAGMTSMPTRIVNPPVPPIMPRKPRRRAILSVGRFIVGGHSKRQDLQVEAFRALIESGVKDVELHLAGSSFPEASDIDFLASIREAASDLPVFFHINCSASELGALYGESLVYWHATGLGRDLEKEPEKAEHFGISIVEAMSGGAIPITLRAGGPTEIITEGVNGFFYDDIAGLVDQTRRVMNDTSEDELQRLSLTAHSRALDFSYGRFNDAVSSLFGQEISEDN